MNARFKAKWMAALRSGQYRQGRSRLRTKAVGRHASGYCCLGVACDISGDYKWVRDEGGDWAAQRAGDYGDLYLPAGLAERIGLTGDQCEGLSKLNDCERLSFDKIADYIEANL